MTKMNLPMIQNHRNREQAGGCQGEWAEGGIEWEVGVSRGNLLYIEWIDNKILLHSTENYFQYPVIIHSGKEFFFKVYRHMYNWITLLYSSDEHNIVNQLYFN